MITPELIAYIKSALAKGQTMDTIKAPLLSAGWDEADLQEAFSAVKPAMPPMPTAPAPAASPAPTTAPVSAPAVAPMSTPTMNTGLSSAAMVQPTTPVTPLGTPAASASAPASSPNPDTSLSRQFFTNAPFQMKRPENNPTTFAPIQPPVQAPTTQSPLQPVGSFIPNTAMQSQPPTFAAAPLQMNMPQREIVVEKAPSTFLRSFVIFALIGALIFAAWYYRGKLQALLGINPTTGGAVVTPGGASSTTLPPAKSVQQNTISVPAAQASYIINANTSFANWIVAQGGFSEYKVNNITFVAAKASATGTDAEYFKNTDTADAFIVSVDFSVKPLDAKKDFWTAGNGTVAADGWVNGKLLFVTVDKNANGEYIVKNAGTGL